MPFGILTLPVIIVLFQGKYQISAELKDKEINNLKEKLKSLQVLRRVTHTQPPLSGSATHASTLPLLPSLSFLPFSFSKTREKKFSKGEVNKGSSCPTKSGAREGRGGVVGARLVFRLDTPEVIYSRPHGPLHINNPPPQRQRRVFLIFYPGDTGWCFWSREAGPLLIHATRSAGLPFNLTHFNFSGGWDWGDLIATSWRSAKLQIWALEQYGLTNYTYK